MRHARLLGLMLAASFACPAAYAGDGAPPPEKKPLEAKPAAPKAAEAKPAEKKPAPPAPPLAKRTPRSKIEALRILEQVEVSVEYDAVPVADAVNHLSLVTGVNMILGPALLKEGNVEGIKATLKLRKVTGRQALELLADGLSLGIGFESGVVLVTTPKEARGKPVLRLYPVADLAMAIRDFPGPDLMLHPAGSELKIEESKEQKAAYSDPDDLLRLLRDNTGDGTWEDEGVSASTLRDWILVKQYPDVHQEIASLLAAVRAAR